MTEAQLNRVHNICFEFPKVTERPSHGQPTFFVRKKVFVMFADNHHNDGRTAVWAAASPGLQEQLINTNPKTFFKPPYVGTKGWIGIQLNQINDDDLQFYISDSWFMIAPKKLQAQLTNQT